MLMMSTVGVVDAATALLLPCVLFIWALHTKMQNDFVYLFGTRMSLALCRMCCELNAPVIIWISHIASVAVERNKVAAVLKWKWVQNEWEKDNLKVKQKHLREKKKTPEKNT